ncbi:MAG: 4Fe-4S binding protein, partial [Gemmatimonadota bacterium]
IYEAQLDSLDHELAHLIEHYMADGGAAGIMRPQPALHRVVPAAGAVKSEWILPYDDVRAYLEQARTFSVRDCICRVQQDLLESRRCDFPLRNCVSFSPAERPPRPGDISRDEALAILDECEAAGLVHSVSNVAAGVGYVCNCCGCCCGVLRGITDFGIEGSMAAASYRAVVDADACGECGRCAERCQVDAVDTSAGVAVVDADRCIGCGLCVTTCPEEAIALERLPEDRIVPPPPDFGAWERQRLASRGLG